MRGITRSLVAAAVATVGVVGFAAQAQAVELYTDASQTTLVNESGSGTATATSGEVRLEDSLFGFAINVCQSSSIDAVVTENTGAITADLDGAGSTWNSCDSAVTGNGTWELAIDVNDSTNPFAGEVRDVSVNFAGDTWNGTLASSSSGWNNNGSGAAQIVLTDTGTLSNGFLTGRVDGTWTLQGSGASWTIG